MRVLVMIIRLSDGKLKNKNGDWYENKNSKTG